MKKEEKIKTHVICTKCGRSESSCLCYRRIMKALIIVLIILASALQIKAQDTVYVYQENSMIRINDLYSKPIFLNPGHASFRLRGNNFVIKDGVTNQEFAVGTYDEIFDNDTSGFATQQLAINYLTTILNRGRYDVALQDQTTQAVIQKFNKIGANTTLKADVSVGDTLITVLDTTGITANSHIIIFNPTLARFTSFDVLSTLGADTLILDSPLDVAYDSASFVDLTSTNLAVDGSSSIKTFGLRGVSASPIGITVDITRILITCQTSAAIDLSKFGDIAGGITRGLVLRVRNGEYFNVFNVKTNGELANLGYDFNALTATNPAQGQDGFLFRLTFASQGKIGVAIRLRPGEDLEFLVQDDLSSITLFEVMAEGHIVEE